jgi:hypothetical protein
MSVQTHPMSELRQDSPTDKVQPALDEALARHRLASFAGIKELYQDLGSEPVYLLRSPANAERLLTALTRAQAGTTEPQSLDELRRDVGLESDTGSDRRPSRGKTRDMTTNLPD